MTDDVEMEARGESHVGFEGERFLLLAPAAQGPLHRERARQQADGETGVLKPARGKIQGGLQPGAAGLPSQINDAAFSEACRLDPLQHVGGPPPIVTDKPSVPEEGERERCDYVDENETPHGASAEKSYFLRMLVRKGEKRKKGFRRLAMSLEAFRKRKRGHSINTPAQAELGRATLRSSNDCDRPGHPAQNRDSDRSGFYFSLSHLPARTKAPVVALITPMPFLSVSLVP